MVPIAFKIQAYQRLAQVDTSNEAKVVGFLAARGFEPQIERASDAQFFIVHGRQGACVMDLREVSPRGYDRSSMRALAKDRRLFYVDAGKVSPEQAAWTTWAYFQYRRLSGYLGFTLPKRLTFAVFADRSCPDTDWSDIVVAPTPTN